MLVVLFLDTLPFGSGESLRLGDVVADAFGDEIAEERDLTIVAR